MVYYWDSTGIWGSGILRHPPYWTRSRPQSRRTLVLHRIVFFLFDTTTIYVFVTLPNTNPANVQYIQTQPHDVCIFIIKWLFQHHPLNITSKWIPSSFKASSRYKNKNTTTTWEICWGFLRCGPNIRLALNLSYFCVAAVVVSWGFNRNWFGKIMVHTDGFLSTLQLWAS